MRLTVLGGTGAWPGPGQACSGYVVEHAGYRLLLDPGYATFPQLQRWAKAEDVDAVYVSHGHPDHCADLNPLLRARVLRDDPVPPLPLSAPRGALDVVLALDRPGMLDPGYVRHDFEPGESLTIGPFRARTWLLPHSKPNAGVRLEADGVVLAFTGDTGPSPHLATLARDADVLIIDSSYAEEVPEDTRGTLLSARQAGELAAIADVRRVVLTHLMPEVDDMEALQAASASFAGPIDVATIGLRVTVP